MLVKKSFINAFIMTAIAVVVSSCVPKATEKKAVCGTNQAYSSVTRSCYSIEELRAKPVGTKTTDTLLEETPKTITLSYTDANKDLALSCKVSAISSNVEVISPLLINNGLANKIDEVYDIAYTLANSIPAPSNVTADNYRLAMLASVIKIKTSFYHGTIISELSSFKTQATYLTNLALTFPAVVNVQNYYKLTQKKLLEFEPYVQQVENRCECNAGTCTTFVAPKLNKSGSAGFSYTITDIDGESPSRAVSLSIAAMSTSSVHLKPVAKSGSDSKVESNTSDRPTYTITIPDAGDIAGTATSSFQYSLSIAPTKGTLSDCMGLNGSSSNDRSCNYKPTSGDANNLTPTAIVAGTAATSAPINGVNGVTYTAVAPGANGNNISVQYFNLQNDNSSTDSYVNKSSAFGLISSADGESFVRVVGNAIKVFINPDFTSSAKIRALVNAHPQASKLVVASGGTAGDYPVSSSAIFLTGGANAYDTFSYNVNNQLTGSAEVATFTIDITPNNDYPMVPKTAITGFVTPTETFTEETGKTVTIDFKDVDSTAGFNIDAKIDTSAVAAGLGCIATTQFDFDSLTTSANFTIPLPIVAPTCLSGECSSAVTITPGLNFTGNACLYYQVTDSGGLISLVQARKIVVNGVNDAPLLSKNTINTTLASPPVTALDPVSIQEDLASGLSYVDMYATPGGGDWEKTQLLTIELSSSDTSKIPSVACQDYMPGAGDPTTAGINPGAVSKYFDKTNYRCYVSTGTAWKLFPSLTAYPNCAYTSYGQGAPTTTPSAGIYLDTRNNKCYIPSGTGWVQDSTLQNYKISFVPATDKSGTSTITVKVTDNGSNTAPNVNTVSGTFVLTVVAVNDPPVFRQFISTIHTNEGGDVQTDGFIVDEDDGATADEDTQGVRISSITTDNISVLPTSAISIFYDANDNGVEDTGEARAIGANLEGPAIPADRDKDVSAHKFYLKLDPVDGVSGNANVTLTIHDGTTPVSKSFAFIVHPIAALHGGWNNISSAGLKTDKNGAPVADSEIQCNYNKSTDTAKCSTATTNCTGSSSPHGLVTPTAADTIFWDSTNKKCYRSTSNSEFSWVDLKTSCPITRQAGACSGGNCIISDTPANADLIPTFVGQYAYDSVGNKCYVSTGKTADTEWEEYVPSKVTLAWKPFTLVGNDPAIGAVQIAGWNVYRREAGTDYNLKGGHLKNTSSNATFTITDPSVRTFTDTTAIAGRVYYYQVRPVDNTSRNFPTFTPEIFSEVRVLAAPANYAFVHRWMVNQEVCNGMNITTSTTPYHVDASHNFRCEYVGPGMTDISSTKYYDYGRDLLVDTQELGCAYAPAPKCSANGCVGIGAPVSTSGGVANDDLYYDRSTGSCYMYNSGWALVDENLTAVIANKLPSALNAPLVNVTQDQAVSICEARTKPTLSGVTVPGAAKVTLPSKKDYMGYASHKLNITDAEITEMEQGFSLNVQSRCNGSKASGLETAYSDSPIPSTSFIYSLPGTSSSNIRSMYTGSIAWGSSKGTEACVSRFGIQDVYGNVAEWTTDKMSCVAAANTYDCEAVGADFVVNAVAPLKQYGFNMETGPYNDANGDAKIGAPLDPMIGDDGYLTSWAFADQLFDSGKFNLPMGLPYANSVVNEMAAESLLDWVLSIGPSSGITTAKLHEDGIITNHEYIRTKAGGSKIGGFAVGGSYLSGNLAGRFTSELILEDEVRPDVGLRCILPIQNSYYGADSKHPYSY